METLSPGVYTQFTDKSVYAAMSVALTGLFIGTAHQGTLEPKFITNPDEFLAEYGKPQGDSYFHYAVLSYLKYGRFCWVRRVATSAVAQSTVNVPDASSITSIIVQSSTEGDLLNGYKINILEDNTVNLLAKKSSASTVTFTGTVEQPTTVTGVVLSNPTGATVVGSALDYANAATTLAWGGGAAVDVSAGGSFDLTNAGATSTVTATVAATSLPVADQSDSLAVTAIVSTPDPVLSGLKFSSPTGTLTTHNIEYTYTNDTDIKLKIDAGVNSVSIHDQSNVTIADGSTSLLVNIVKDGFKITIKDVDSKLVETLDKLVKDPTSDYYVEDRVSKLSKYITVTDIIANSELPKVTTDDLLMSGGNAGMSGVTEADYIGEYSESSEEGLKGFSNKEKYTIDFVSLCGQTSAAIIQAVIEFCSLRGDCMGLLDTPSGLNPTQAVQWMNGEGAYTDHQAFDSMFVQFFHDWLKYYDAYTEQYLWMPPTVNYINLLAKAYREGKQYQAIAGYSRGKVNDALDVQSSPDQNQRDLMLGDSLHNNLNPYVKFVRDGIILFGQKTAQRKNSSTNRANSVRTLLYLFRQVSDIAKTVLFEPNDADTWRSLKSLVDPILSDLKSAGKRALFDGKFVCDNSTNPPELIDQNKLGAKLYVKFMKTAEMIEIDIIATNQGADFSLV